ncbi:MAG: hypothetical protein HQL69_21595 [Magnetococcales bacterium]|nr:hypothetical protein [Magnetococcales bacterium]
MSNALSQADLIADLKASLNDTVDSFTAVDDNDFIRHLSIAASELTRFKPRKLVATITLTAEQSLYDAPADIINPTVVLWGSGQRQNVKPWENSYPSKPPTISLLESAGVKKIQLTPAPTQNEINKLGAEFAYTYSASHIIAIDAADTTINPADRDLLLLRARAEALLEIATSNTTKAATRAPGQGQPKNSSAMAIHDNLISEFEKRAKL